MSDAKHTPGKWRHHDMEHATVVAGTPGVGVADCNATHRTDKENEANAQRIVTAVNCHDDLVEALQDLVARVDDDPNYVPMSEALIRAREAIARARG